MDCHLKVLLADADKDYCQLLKSFLSKNGLFDPILTVNDGRSMIDVALREMPDAIICDLALPNIDGLSALKEIFSNTVGKRPITFLLSAFNSEYSMRMASELKIDQVLMKPCHFGMLTEHLKRCCNQNDERVVKLAENQKNYITTHVNYLLAAVNFPTHLKGYGYLYNAMMMCTCCMPTAGITKSLYPEIGKMYGVSAYCIERSIRAAITVAWEQGGSQLFSNVFPSLKLGKKPSNWQLISAAVISFERKQLEL